MAAVVLTHIPVVSADIGMARWHYDRGLAWILATATEPYLRDGERAVVLAERVVAAGASASTLDTLAAALAESGRFDEAIAMADRALAILDSTSGDFAAEIMGRRELYLRERPFRDPAVGLDRVNNVP